ncbi:hypothetical protein Tco_0686825 [Tanacetum coccineum]
MYLKGQPKLGLWYPKDSPFDLVAYTDSDYAGASLDRKSTTGGCQFLGCRLISWQCKKQTVVANSTTEAEYVAASSCCGQVLWIQNQLLDYGYNFMHTKIFIDNNSTICIIKNPVFHSKTKHIEIRHHFIRDCNEKKLIQMVKIHTDKNVADLLTKAFDKKRQSVWNGIRVNAGNSKLMLLGINLLLLVKVNVARHNLLLLVKVNVARHNLLLLVKVNAARHNLLLLGYYCWTKATVKEKIVNGEVQLQALVDGKKVIIAESTDFQDSPDDEEDTRSSHEHLNNLEEKYKARAFLAKSKSKKVILQETAGQRHQLPFQPKLLHSSEHKPKPRLTKDFEAKYNKVKAKLALLSSSASAPSSSSSKNKGLIAETYDWDEEEVSSDENEVTKVKALMALTDEERVFVGKESANNGEWVKISIQKVHALLEMEDNDDRKSFLDYLCIDLNYVEEQRINLLSKHRNLVHKLNTCKEQLLVLKQAKLDRLTMQHVNTEILNENQNLRNELKELTT